MAYSDVNFVRERMAEALTVPASSSKGRKLATSPKISGFGDVWGPVDDALRARARKKYVRENEERRDRAAVAGMRQQELWKNYGGDWR